jgi:phosphoglycerate-specific signal transduction histidine kinase
MTTNPIAKHTSTLFASRDRDFDAAIAYAKEVIEAMPNETRSSAYTALMVVVNTAANVCCTQSQSPSPERLALIELIDERINARLAVEFKEQEDLDQVISDWIDANLDVDDKISNWMSDNFDVTDYNINDAISEWASNNLADEVESVIKNSLTFSVIVN